MRLTNKFRDAVSEKVVDSIINPKIEVIREKVHAIADKVVDNLYSKSVKDWMGHAPVEDIFGTKTQFKISYTMNNGSFDSFYHELLEHVGTWQKGYVIPLSNSIKLLPDDYSNSYLKANKTQTKELKTVFKSLNTLEKEKSKIQATINSAVYSCNTVKQLAEKYPDLVEFMPPIEAKSKALVVTADTVRQILKS